MALTIPNGYGGAAGGGILHRNSTTTPCTYLSRRRHLNFSPSTTSRTLHVVSAKKFSSRTGRFDSKNRKTGTITKEPEKDEEVKEEEDDEFQTVQIDRPGPSAGNRGIDFVSDDKFPELPGLEPDFWEGPQWDPLGFLVEFLWAFGIVFAVIACGVAVATYNEGATDFKNTPAYKESVQSRDLLEEEPESSNSDVFEANPTEVAPSLD